MDATPFFFSLKRAVIKLKNFFEDEEWAQDFPFCAHKIERFSPGEL